MAFEYKYQILRELISLAGGFVSSQITKPSYDDQEKLLSEYYAEARDIAKREDIKKEKTQRRIMEESSESRQEEDGGEEEPARDLTSERIEKGVACLPCSSDHFSTVSGALSEALRFARKGGIDQPEVHRRFGLARDELNIMERIDLSPEQLVQLHGRDKQLAEWGLNASRDIRHKITAVQTPEDLERVAADAAKVRTEFMRNLWSIATVDGSIDKLCKGLKDEERERCINTINLVLKDKKETPP